MPAERIGLRRRRADTRAAALRSAIKAVVLSLLLMTASASDAMELTGRVAMAGITALAEAGDAGYQEGGDNLYSSDVESLRLMGSGELGETVQWNLHYQLVRRASDLPSPVSGYTTLFRADPLRGDLAGDATTATTLYHEADWLNLRARLAGGQLTLGRQPLSWGSGRIWQPLDIFGAFAPLELDTEYKPGIDALLYETFPSVFSSLSLVYVQTPYDSDADPAYALHYRRQAGSSAELTVQGGRVMDYTIVGGGVEGSVGGAGLRLEGVALQGPAESDAAIFIAGSDYRFANGTLLIAEFYHNGFGAADRQALLTAPPLAAYPALLTPHLGRDLLALSLGHDLTPLLRGSYTLLHSQLRGAPSQLHQLTLSYSIADEADTQLAWSVGRGEGSDSLGQPRSDFGHLPQSLYLRVQFYF